MTIDEAIKWCESRYQGALMPGATEAYKMCIAALRAQQKAEKNEPLTLEELRKMNGEPVCLSDGRWFLIQDNDFVVDQYGRKTSIFLVQECGAYRRPPKEEM